MPQYKMFRIGSLFKKLSTKYFGVGARYSDVSDRRTDEYCVPVTSAKRGDNGICRWAKPGQFETHYNVISIVYNGAIAAGLAYYQPFDVSVLADSYLIGLRNGDLNEGIGLYLACAIQKVTKAKYSRENKAVWSRIKNEFIELPVTAGGVPDYDYMSEYISSIKSDYMTRLGACVVGLGLDDTCVSDYDLAVLSQTVETKPFRVGSLFDSIRGIKQAKSQKRIPTDPNGIPYVVQSTMNNMVSRYVDRQWLIDHDEPPAPGNAICLGVTLPAVSYQPFEFGASQIIEARSSHLDELTGPYFVACFRKQIERFSYDQKPGIALYKAMELELPATSSGMPDYEYMRAYIRAQQKQVLGEVMAGI